MVRRHLTETPARASRKANKIEEDEDMKRWKITYFLRPEAENVVTEVSAETYEDACIWAKGFRREGFRVDEVLPVEERYRELAEKMIRLEAIAYDEAIKGRPRHGLGTADQRIAGMRLVLLTLGVDVSVDSDEYGYPVAATIGGVRVTLREARS